MKIALTAPAGKVGAATLAAARQRGIPLRALARDLTRLPAAADGAEEAVRFDFTDPRTYAPALAAVQTLVLVSPASPRQVEVDRGVIDAARAAGVTHVVKLSAAGADDAATRFAAGHRAVEAYIQASGLAWTIVRPTFFMENMLARAAAIAAGTYPAPTGHGRMTQIAVADIAAVLLTAAAEPGAHHGAIYTLTGDSADKGDEIAATLAAAAGHPVQYVDVPEEVVRQNLLRTGLDEWMADGVLEGFRKVRTGAASQVTDDLRRVTGRAPLDFATWACAHAGAFSLT